MQVELKKMNSKIEDLLDLIEESYMEEEESEFELDEEEDEEY